MKTPSLSWCSFLALAGLAWLAFPPGTAQAQNGNLFWTGTPGDGKSWLNPENWFAQIPGSTSVTTNTDVATIGFGGQTSIGIGSNSYYLGAILLNGTMNHSVGYGGAGASTFSGMTLFLNGSTVNGVANTVLYNSGSANLTFSNLEAGNDAIVLNNTNNVIEIDSSGGISLGGGGMSVLGTGKNLTFNGIGTGILTLSQTSYSGTTTINGGTLKAGGFGLASTSSIAVTNGGTLLLASAGVTAPVNVTAPITLGSASISGQASILSRAGLGVSGGNLGTGSAAGLGALALTANAAIDFGGASTGNGTLTFGGTTAFAPAAFTLSVLNYNGTTGGAPGVDGTNDRLIFDSDQTANLGHFAFVNPNGATGTFAASEIPLGNGFFEVVAAPEPSAWVCGGLGVAALLSFHRRRRQGLATRS